MGRPDSRTIHCRATYPTSIHGPTCNAGYIRADDIETATWNEVIKVIEHPEVMLADFKRRIKAESRGDGHKVEKELLDEQKKLETCNEREKRLLTLFEFDGITKDELLERVNKIKAERQEAEKRLAQLTAIKKQTVNMASVETELNKFCTRVKESLNNCTFINKRLALDILQFQVIATPESLDIIMAVPLEFTTIERTHKYNLTKRKRRCYEPELISA